VAYFSPALYYFPAGDSSGRIDAGQENGSIIMTNPAAIATQEAAGY
jgi:hypothetical protein